MTIVAIPSIAKFFSLLLFPVMILLLIGEYDKNPPFSVVWCIGSVTMCFTFLHFHPKENARLIICFIIFLLPFWIVTDSVLHYLHNDEIYESHVSMGQSCLWTFCHHVMRLGNVIKVVISLASSTTGFEKHLLGFDINI